MAFTVFKVTEERLLLKAYQTINYAPLCEGGSARRERGLFEAQLNLHDDDNRHFSVPCLNLEPFSSPSSLQKIVAIHGAPSFMREKKTQKDTNDLTN